MAGRSAVSANPPSEGGTPQERDHNGPPVRSRRPSDFDSQQRMWAMWCHLSALGAFIVPIGSVVGPLVVWLTKRQDYPLVDKEGKKALNFQITVAICFLLVFALFFAAAASGGGVLAAVVAVVGGVLGITWLVLVILAAIRTNEATSFHYPFSITFLK